MFEDDSLVDLTVQEKNRARELIEDFMIAANGVDRALPRSRRASPSLRRVVRSPERWQTIVAVAAEQGERLPPEPDAAALEAFLMRAPPRRPPALPGPLARHRQAHGRGRVRRRAAGPEGRGPLRPRGPRLHALDGAEPALPRPDHAAPAQGRARRAAARLRRGTSSRSSRRTARSRRTTRTRSSARCASPRPRCSSRAGSASASTRSSPARRTRARGSGSSGRPSRASSCHGFEGLEVGDKLRVKLISTDFERGFIDFVRVG